MLQYLAASPTLLVVNRTFGGEGGGMVAKERGMFSFSHGANSH